MRFECTIYGIGWHNEAPAAATNVAAALISVAWFARRSWKTTRLTANDSEIAQETQEAIIEEGIR